MKSMYLFVILTMFLLVGCATEQPAVEQDGDLDDQQDSNMPPQPPEMEDIIVDEENSIGGELVLNDKNFEPEELTLSVGSAVLITNAGQEIHVVSSPNLFDGVTLYPRESYEYVFAEQGEYNIETTLGAEAKVIVK